MWALATALLLAPIPPADRAPDAFPIFFHGLSSNDWLFIGADHRPWLFIHRLGYGYAFPIRRALTPNTRRPYLYARHYVISYCLDGSYRRATIEYFDASGRLVDETPTPLPAEMYTVQRGTLAGEVTAYDCGWSAAEPPLFSDAASARAWAAREMVPPAGLKR
jgi:hypothetical protein